MKFKTQYHLHKNKMPWNITTKVSKTSIMNTTKHC